MEGWRARLVELAPWGAASLLITLLLLILGARLGYPFDLEWMEGGMLAHAWRLDRGLPLYVAPNPEFIPFIYPPGYAALVAGVGEFTGLSLPVGRAISLAGLAAAAGAIGFAVWRHTGVASAAVFGAVAFVGAYPASGAFYDLVRPDSVALGLTAWALVLSAERWRGAVEAAGLLLCAAFLCKHNSAAFGVPIAVGLLARDGWRSAARFALVSAVPALLFTAMLQITSDGHFLRYLIEVPASHPQHGNRVLPGLPRELGNALPISVAALGLWAALRPVRRVPAGLASGLAVVGGVGLATGVHLSSSLPEDLLHLPAALGGFGLGAMLVGVTLTLGAGGDRSWRWVWAVAVGATALGVAGLMRSHHGGYLNVYMPLHWAVAAGFGLVLGQLHRGGWKVLAALLATVELLFLAGRLDVEALSPTLDDVEAGQALVYTLKTRPGPVLSPFAAWIPAQAGHPPSLHMIALWDLVYEGGPYLEEAAVVERAIAAHHWPVVVAGNRPFTYSLEGAYTVERSVLGRGGALTPKTGWIVRPTRLLVPR